jgi:hypothetical protein
MFIHKKMFDATEAKTVEIVVANDRVWVNVDGACALRVYRIGVISIDDRREDEEAS